MFSYATLEDIRYWHEATYDDPATQAALANDEIRLMQIARTITREIDDVYTRMTFAPEIATRYYDASYGQHISKNLRCLNLDYPLASLTSATLADDTALVSGTSVLTSPKNRQPYWELRIPSTQNYAWTQYSNNDYEDGIEIAGIWTWRTAYDSLAWVSTSDTVQDDPLSSSATTITVGNADGANALGIYPRFSIGQILRIESEFVIVLGVDYTTNSLTVQRGVRGSTAAAHVQTTAIESYSVEPAIVEACALATLYRYSRIGKFQNVSVGGVSQDVQSFPVDLPDRAIRILRQYTAMEFRSI